MNFSPTGFVFHRHIYRERREYEWERPLIFDQINIDPNARRVNARGQEICLTVTEFDLLVFLARHPCHFFAREQLLERIWGSSEYIDPGTVTVYIRRLRKKLEKDPNHPIWLITKRGMGYKFNP